MNVQSLSAAPGLPSRIDFLTSAMREKTAARGQYLLREQLDEQARYLRRLDYRKIAGDGRLGGEYRVLARTNYNGLVLLAHFLLLFYEHLRFDFKEGASTVPTIRYEGVVDSLSACQQAGALLPPIDRRLDIVDYRLKDAKPIDFILYSVTNRSWPQAITKDMLANLSRRKDFNLARTLSHVNSVRGLFITLLILAGFLPLPIMLVVRRQKKKTNQSKGIG